MNPAPNITPISPDVEFRQAPHNLEAEQALLGAILVNNEALTKVRDFLQPDMFYEPVHGRVYDCILKLADKGQVADPVKLKPFFEQDEGLKDVGGTTYLVRLAASAATILNAYEYGCTVREFAHRRYLIDLGERLVLEAYDADIDVDSEELLADHEARLTSFSEDATDHRDTSYRDQATAVQVMYEAIKSAKEIGFAGVSTGIPPLDDLIGGLQEPDMTLLAGRPSMGKSAIAASIAAHVAGSFTRTGKPAGVLWCSAEMNASENNMRLVSRAIRMNEAISETVPYNMLRSGKATDSAMELVDAHLGDVMALNIKWLDEGKLTPSRIRARIERARREFAKDGVELALFVVDYLQIMKADREKQSRYEEVTELSSAVRTLSKDQALPSLALAQLSRECEKRANKRPMLSDLREAGGLEQDAANVVMLYRPDYYLKRELPDPGSPQFCEKEAELARVRGQLELIVPKVRNGSIGTAHLQADWANNYFMPDPTFYHDL